LTEEQAIQLGKLIEAVDGLKGDMGRLQARMDGVALDTSSMKRIIDRGRGAVVGVLGLGGALGAMGGWLVSWFKGE